MQTNAHFDIALYRQKSSSLSLPFIFVIVEITTGLIYNSYLEICPFSFHDNCGPTFTIPSKNLDPVVSFLWLGESL